MTDTACSGVTTLTITHLFHQNSDNSENRNQDAALLRIFSKLDEMKTEPRKTVSKMLHYNAFFSKSDKMKTELRKIVSNVMVFFLIHVKNV